VNEEEGGEEEGGEEEGEESNNNSTRRKDDDFCARQNVENREFSRRKWTDQLFPLIC